jgi:hypothetical protein
MSVRILLSIFTAIAGIVLSSCATEPVDFVAQRMTIIELNTSAAYLWFPAETQVYNARSEYVSEISQRFTADTRALIYVRPSCSCRGTQKLFPQVVKTLMQAGIREEQIEIYSMRSNQDKHPYAESITISNLPTIMIVQGETINPRIILDQDFNGVNADSLMASVLR